MSIPRTPLLSSDEQTLVSQCRDMRPSDVALRVKASPTVRPQVVATQVDCLQRLRLKVPTWASAPGLYVPTLLAAQQCSSEAIARWRRSLVGTDELVDLTGGLGVDCFFMSQGLGKTLYVESNEVLALAAKHNYSLLGREDIEVSCSTAELTLKDLHPSKRTIFLDPYRRSSTGRKVVRIADCTPDVSTMADGLLARAAEVFVKLSPMLDVSEALATLPSVSDIYCVGANGECKELLVRMLPGYADEANIVAVDIDNDIRTLAFTLSEEKKTPLRVADDISEGMLLYEPSAAMMKAAPYALISNRFGLSALHPFTHLYVTDNVADLTGLPGRSFTIKEVYPADKKALKALTKRQGGASVVVRNFNTTADELRKRLSLKENPTTFLFAATSQCRGRLFIVAQKN